LLLDTHSLFRVPSCHQCLPRSQNDTHQTLSSDILAYGKRSTCLPPVFFFPRGIRAHFSFSPLENHPPHSRRFGEHRRRRSWGSFFFFVAWDAFVFLFCARRSPVPTDNIDRMVRPSSFFLPCLDENSLLSESRRTAFTQWRFRFPRWVGKTVSSRDGIIDLLLGNTPVSSRLV